MRSAERSALFHARLHALAALCALAAGCSSLPNPMQALQRVVTPAPAPAPAPAPTTTPAVTPAASLQPARETPSLEVVELPPVSPAVQRAFDDAGRALRERRLDEAERGFRALAQAHPELGGAQANLGVIYRQQGKPKEAVAALEKAVQQSPSRSRYHNELGIAYRLQGDFAKARTAYERAIELDAGYAAPVLNLGILHELYLRDEARALALYTRYQEMTDAKDTTVAKWVADLQNRQRKAAQPKVDPPRTGQPDATKKEPS
jgi:tetratricopeptide (TPR) repeat protein